jgi:hypothetical protein
MQNQQTASSCASLSEAIALMRLALILQHEGSRGVQDRSNPMRFGAV